jgi:MFS family permease
VIALGFVSLFMDTSSEIIHSLLPAFLVTVLGVNAFSVGFIEGVSEATVSVAKVFSGAISDWIGKRKLLVLLGYGLAALTKPLFPLADGIALIFAARFLDRIGKGIRGAPRDALIADVTPKRLRGTAFGLRQSMDTVGAFLGPLLAILLMTVTGAHPCEPNLRRAIRLVLLGSGCSAIGMPWPGSIPCWARHERFGRPAANRLRAAGKAAPKEAQTLGSFTPRYEIS